ncbi:MAG: hypothetical protein OXC62_03755 [Aestuariivita sp.]|nr:hypothetical protein [Aestuariivita sp.]
MSFDPQTFKAITFSVKLMDTIQQIINFGSADARTKAAIRAAEVLKWRYPDGRRKVSGLSGA